MAMGTLLIPLLFFGVWLVVVVYLFQLATRLVQAVERIADRLSEPHPRPTLLA